MVDGGRETSLPPPVQPYLNARVNETDQWKWMVGRDFHSLKFADAVSPKLRAPTHAYVFEGFEQTNQVVGEKFVALGSLAQGGLSNAWGCGVAKLSPSELADYPFDALELEESYETVSRRMGISGACSDDLTDYFGLDAWADQPIEIDALQSRLLARYQTVNTALTAQGFRLGRSRVAALSQDKGGRQACNLSGNCLWGCNRKALYSAVDDLAELKKYPNFTYLNGLVVNRVLRADQYPCIQGHEALRRPLSITGKKVLLAAGTLATTRLAMIALGIHHPLKIKACPVAAFMLWRPMSLGLSRAPAFGLGQLSFALSLSGKVSSDSASSKCVDDASLSTTNAFGSLFNTTGIPIAEFAKFMPLRKPLAIQFLRSLLSSCTVGNVYLPGSYTNANLTLDAENVLRVSGDYTEDVDHLMKEAEIKLRSSFLKLGALMLPKSFTLSRPGGDLHHACSLPMRREPTLCETSVDGELFGLRDVHVVDGACLTSISEKSHTLTIMANADRIARRLVFN
jgi:choline dehydrogenase-like flavoprotein